MNPFAQLCSHRAWLRLKLPVALLVALLQRSPALQLLTTAENLATTSPAGAVLKAALAAVASLGAMHSLAGATNLVSTQPSPANVNTTTRVQIGFTVTDTINIASWKIGGNIPPGLTLFAREGGGVSLEGPGILDASTPGMDDGYGGTSGGNPSTTPILTGTPTTAGTYVITLQAWEFSRTAGLASNTFNYTINVAGAATTTPATPPTISTQPAPQTGGLGGSATFTVAASGSPTFQWQLNGTPIAGATSASLSVSNLQPANAGIYTAVSTNSSGTAASNAAILGITSTAKLTGAGQEFPDITAPTGNVYDQILLGGPAATVKADANQILRISFIDLNDDIVQVEYSGAGTLTLVLDGASGPAAPTKYNQATAYMKGHAGIVLTGADETTNLSIFSVGRANAANQALFRSDVTYDGFADIAFVAITSANGKFGGLRAANTSCFATKGFTGLYAPGVQFTGPVFLNDINASDAATPVYVIGSGSDVRVTGGDLLQTNGRAVQVSGITQLKFTAGSDSHGKLFNAQNNKGKFDQSGTDVTSQIVVNPTP